MKSTCEIIIHQPQISLKRSQSGETYFFILDPATYIAYFAFPDSVKEGLSDLLTKWTKAYQIHLRLGRNRKKVFALTILTQEEVRERERERERVNHSSPSKVFKSILH